MDGEFDREYEPPREENNDSEEEEETGGEEMWSFPMITGRPPPKRTHKQKSSGREWCELTAFLLCFYMFAFTMGVFVWACVCSDHPGWPGCGRTIFNSSLYRPKRDLTIVPDIVFDPKIPVPGQNLWYDELIVGTKTVVSDQDCIACAGFKISHILVPMPLNNTPWSNITAVKISQLDCFLLRHQKKVQAIGRTKLNETCPIARLPVRPWYSHGIMQRTHLPFLTASTYFCVHISYTNWSTPKLPTNVTCEGYIYRIPPFPKGPQRTNYSAIKIMQMQTTPPTLNSSELYEDSLHIKALALGNLTLPLFTGYWWCEGFMTTYLPRNEENLTCVLVTEVSQITAAFPKSSSIRKRRDLSSSSVPYLDAIGVPRGVPNEFKAMDQVAAGFASLIPPVQINKNVDWINYIYYNQQRLANYTRDSMVAAHVQLKATSQMTWENRIALDALLAKEGGVCAMFGDFCCTFIPNNTADNGRFTQAMAGLSSLSKEMAENSGVESNWFASWWDSMWRKLSGPMRAFVTMICTIAFILCIILCCVVPLLKICVTRAMDKAVASFPMMLVEQKPLLGEDNDDELDAEPVVVVA